MARKLDSRLVEKPWGRDRLPPMFGGMSGRRIGELWFSAGEELPLLVKYIFTSEPLSIQVHPGDRQARERGLPRGKTECWFILDADPGARLGLGLRRGMSRDELRSAASDGSIEQLIDWRPVQAGDFLFVPAGTVHAIGAGVSLLEIQQNSDVTYRLYDYGRPRELHLDDAIAVADPGPYPADLAQHVPRRGSRVLAEGPHFTVIHDACGKPPANGLAGRRRWVVPIAGEVSAAGERAVPGECLLVEPDEQLDAGDARVLIAAEGSLDEAQR